MSEYVVVTRPAQCYSYICRDQSRKEYLQCSDDNWREGEMPIRDKTYLFVCSNTHPSFSSVTLATIEDVESGQRYVVDTIGLQMVGAIAETVDLHSRYLTGIDTYEGIIREESQENSNKQMSDNIKVGDLVIVKKPGDGHDGELMKITHLKAYNYDYVVCYPHQNVAQYGYNKGQVVKYVPEPELPEDQKPAFSRSELIEILEQNKPAEEILLDIKDHITN